MSVLGLISAALLRAAPDPLLAQAAHYSALGLYSAAITEYRRFIFFNPADPGVSDAHAAISDAYCLLDDFDRAIEALRTAVETSGNDSARYERRLDLAVRMIAAGRYSQAEMTLRQFEMSGAPPRLKNKAVFLEGVCSVYAFKWQSARRAFQEYFAAVPAPLTASAVDSLVAAADYQRLKSADTARWLSTYIPGAGQVYAGDIRNGLNSFLLNGALLSWIAYKLVHGYWRDAYLIFAYLESRYYSGSRYHAGRRADEYNARANRRHAEAVLRALIDQPE